MLTFFSLFFRLAVKVKNLAYDSGVLKPKKVDTHVISVGNIVAGGTGKTPFVALLAQKIGSVTILTRGYRTNDEPKLLKQKLPSCNVVVGKNRVLGAKSAGPISILDDGMQYRKLHRDLEIVLVNSQDPFGKGHFLPRGYLRDTPYRLKYADLIAINHVYSDEEFARAKKRLAKYSNAPCIGMRYQNKPIFKGEKVGVFCALGNPKGFLETVKHSGAIIASTWQLADHAPIKDANLKSFYHSCKKQKIDHLVCSEKDAVKVSAHLLESLPIIVLKGELTITHGAELLTNLLKEIK